MYKMYMVILIYNLDKPLIWKTKDGREILFSDLENEHLDSIIKYLEERVKKKPSVRIWLNIIKDEKIKRSY